MPGRRRRYARAQRERKNDTVNISALRETRDGGIDSDSVISTFNFVFRKDRNFPIVSYIN